MLPEDTAISLISTFVGKCENRVGGGRRIDGEKRRTFQNDLCLFLILNCLNMQLSN